MLHLSLCRDHYSFETSKRLQHHIYKKACDVLYVGKVVEINSVSSSWDILVYTYTPYTRTKNATLFSVFHSMRTLCLRFVPLKNEHSVFMKEDKDVC